MTILTITAHSLAEELRSIGHIEEKASDIEDKRKRIPQYPADANFRQFYQSISDDHNCIKMFFAVNDETITSQGIKVSDKYPLMHQFCSDLFTRMSETSEQFTNEFDGQVKKFQVFLNDLKQSDDGVKALLSSELSPNMSMVKAFALSFNDLCAELKAANITGHMKKEGFANLTNIMLNLLKGAPIDISKFDDDIKKFFEQYQQIDESAKIAIRREFQVLLSLFVKCCFIKRCPIAVSNRLIPCCAFIRDLSLKPMFEYLGIPVDSRLALVSI